VMRFDTNIKEISLKIQKSGSDEVKEIVLEKEYLIK